MRRLIENRAAALRCVEFLRTARAVQIVGVVQRIDHTHLAERAALDELAQMLHGRIERVAVPDDHMHAGTPSRVDDGRAIFDGQRHRFFDQQVLAGLGRLRRMLAMELMRRCDIDRVDGRIGAERRDCVIGVCGKFPGEPFAGLRAGVGGRNEPHRRVAGQCRQHHRKRAAKSGDAETERSCISHRQGPALSLVLS